MGTSWDHESVTELIDPVLVRARSRIGTVIREKWRLDVLLGLGGMAAVYAATHRNGSRVAVKILHTEVSTNPLVRQRFLREGYVANTVAHDGAVKVSDDDVAEDGAAFLVMELLDGETLEERRLRFGDKLGEDDVLSVVATGDVGSHFQRDHRYPGTRPLTRRRFFAFPAARREAHVA